MTSIQLFQTRTSGTNRFTSPLLFSLVLSLALSLSLLSPNAHSQEIKDFNAKFSVEAMGLSLGIASHQWRCQNNNCTLTSSAKPSGFAAIFLKDSSKETVNFKLQDNQLIWQSYHKTGISQKSGTTVTKTTDLLIENNRLICPQKNRDWPVKPKMFDALSIAYGIWHAQLNQHPLDDFVLIDPNFQNDLRLQSQNSKDFIALEFTEGNIDAVKYRFSSPKAQIELWLLPDYQFFPGKVIITNEDNKTLTLSLAEPPKQL